MDIDEISVIGHSVAGVDIPYFKNIDVFTHYKAKWIVYYFGNDEKQRIYNDLVGCGIKAKNIVMKNAREFYNI